MSYHTKRAWKQTSCKAIFGNTTLGNFLPFFTLRSMCWHFACMNALMSSPTDPIQYLSLARGVRSLALPLKLTSLGERHSLCVCVEKRSKYKIFCCVFLCINYLAWSCSHFKTSLHASSLLRLWMAMMCFMSCCLRSSSVYFQPLTREGDRGTYDRERECNLIISRTFLVMAL